ncbi:hypothetical protein CBR_g11015 [Chara braunii]|uniref:Integrase zinc-binding domain-containing protein n=1 Tax=Chara braunii TaxID=69332 RepID=A0A388KPU6_CHABU|nr:hypothetical protein CBR_g11015 [Chara braunii]|eukprot:GBG72081.1 hypothetical protein CBR_g11015 [Chara braunii]
MPDADGIERGPAATPEDFVKTLKKRELARLQVPKIDIFHFEGERVSKWLKLLEQVTAEVPEVDKFKFLPRYIWWEIRPEIMKVVAETGGDWAKFKVEMQRQFKLGDGLLTKTNLEMLKRNEFSTVGVFATAFEKMAKKVPGLAEEEQCATFLWHFKNWEASSLTKKVAPGKKLTWAAIKEGVIEGELDQVDIFQMRQARKKRKALDAITSDGRDFKKMIEDAVTQLDVEKETKRKTMAAPQTQGKVKKAVVQEEEEEEKEEGPEPQKLTKALKKGRNLAQGGQGSGRGQVPQAVAMPPPEPPTPRSGMPYRSPSRTGRVPHAVRTRAKGSVSPKEPAKNVPEISGEKEVVDVPEEEDDEDDRLRKEEDEKVEQRAKKRDAKPDTDKAQEVRNKKYVARVEEGYDVQEIMDRILEGHNHLMNLKDVLASAPRLRDELRARLSRKMVANIRLGTIIPKEAEWAETGTKMDKKFVACGCLDVVVKGKTCTAMVDSGAKMNLIKEEHAVWLGMEVDRSDNGVLMGANSRSVFIGTASSVILEIRKDLQRLNAVTVRDASGLPNADALSEACARRVIISLIDLYSGYDQFPVYPSDRPMTAMHTPRGLIHMNVAPQGWMNVVAMVQRHIVRAMQPISPHITQPYIDDLAVKGPKEKDEQEVMPGVRHFVWDHVQDLCNVLDLLKEHNLTASGSKSRHFMSGATILGFVCDERGRRLDTKKTNKILEWPTPFQTITEVRSFLRTCGFWRIFIKGFAAKTEQLRKLVRQRQNWEWGNKQESVIEGLKKEFEEGGLVLGVSDHAAVMTRPFIIETDAGPTALGGVLIQWLTYIWMFNFELEQIPGNKNRANRLSRVDWDKNNQGVIEDTPPVDGFLDSEEDVRPHINSWALAMGNYVTPRRHVWLAPPGHARRPYLVLKPYIEEDSWGMSGVDWMMELALAGKYELQEDLLTIESGALQVGKHEKVIGGMYLLANALLHEETVRNTVQRQDEDGDNVVHKREDDDFEEGEIKEVFRAEEYEGVYLELGMLLSCEIRERDACARVLKMRPSFLVRDDHLFMRSKGRDPRRVVCGVARQIDIMAALHDGTTGGHKGANTTYLKVHELHYWDGMGQMINDYCKSCVPCQERSALRPREPLHPRYVHEVGAVVHLDLLAMPLGIGSYNFILDARDNLSGFVDGRAIRTKTGETLARCIEEYYLRYPFDLETDLTFEELLDLRARQIGAIEDRIEEAASRTADSRTKDKFRWDKMARVRKEPLKVGDVVLLYDSSLEKQWSRKLDKRWLGPYRVTRYRHGAYQIEELNGAAWKDWVSGSKLKKFVARDETLRSIYHGVCQELGALQKVVVELLYSGSTGRSGEHHQEMRVKLVSTDLLNLRGVMKEGFAAAKASNQKIGDRLTKVAQKTYGQKVDWEREAEGLKKELERQGRELEAVKADMEKVGAENEAVKQVNQTLNKITDALRAYLYAQQISFQAKGVEWEKRIQDLEAKYPQQAPIRVVDWTEVQEFEIKEQPAEEVFKREEEVKKAHQQEGKEIPRIDKEMLEQPGALTEKDAEVDEFEWRMPAGLTLGRELTQLGEGPPAEAMRVEEVPPTTRGEIMGQQEGQESVGQTMVETEQGVDLKDCQESTMPQEVPITIDLRDALGSWATGSGPEGRIGEQVVRADDPPPPQRSHVVDLPIWRMMR